MCEHHDGLTVVACGHHRGARRTARRSGSEVAPQKLVGSHGQKYVFIPAPADV